MPDWVSPRQLEQWLRDGDELALLDVREQESFATGHLLLAACLPLSRLELEVDRLVPRRGTRIALCDAGEAGCELARTAAGRLVELGFREPHVLERGTGGWRNAGHELYTGINVPSKAFGELVEQRCDTPKLSATELRARLDRGEKIAILDSRPLDEYRRMCIPGGIDVPGAELVYRVYDLVPDPETLVVVNCAGRTRSIIGAQSLINAGVERRIAALENGTMGWRLAGYELEHGQERRAPEPSDAGLRSARSAAQRVARALGVNTIERGELDRMLGETEQRTLYVLDVRSPEEFEGGHLPGSRSAPGGQLVQATDEYVATRNARIVLVDDTEVRATMTASWLLQLGWRDIWVLRNALSGVELTRDDVKTGPPSRRVAETLSPAELHRAIEGGEPFVVVDLASSEEFRAGHVPGAWWGVRARLRSCLERLPTTEGLVLTSPDERLAQLAAGDLGKHDNVRVLAGGTNAWQAADLPTEQGLVRAATEVDDVWFRPYQQRGAIERWMREYLTWEVGLVEQLERDAEAPFRPHVQVLR